MSRRFNGPVTGKWRKLKEISLKFDNRICADCNAPDPKWASANIGVFICTACSEGHRSLGEEISKVLSLTQDEWTDDDIDSMVQVGGNSYANATYEAFLPKGYPKPKPNSSPEDRHKFIRSKYELQEFLQPSLRITSSKMSFQSVQSSSTLNYGLFSSSSRKPSMAITGEFVGRLRVTVVKGSQLAVRDMLTSDPYIILTLGKQKYQTTVKKSTLNPEWNEAFTFLIPQQYGPLKLEVYDHDLFNADDIMGEAEIDLQPMIAAALAFGDVGLLGNMQIGKWLKSNDNALVEDSIVNVVGGKIKQEILLKLQNVESGELELEMEWIPLEE